MNKTITDFEIQVVMKALAKDPVTSSLQFTAKIEEILREHLVTDKIYAINLCYYTEENVPEHGATAFVISNQDVINLPHSKIKENIFIQELMDANDCEGIGSIYEISEEEFYEEYDETLISFDF